MTSTTLHTVYTKTPKGTGEIATKSVKLERELGLVFLCVDGKATVAELLPVSGMTQPQLLDALETLEAKGYIAVVAHAPTTPIAQDGMKSDPAGHSTPVDERVQRERHASLEAQVRQEAEARARIRPAQLPASHTDVRQERLAAQLPGETRAHSAPKQAAPRLQPHPEMHLKDLAQKLKAKVRAERRAREEAGRQQYVSNRDGDERSEAASGSLQQSTAEQGDRPTAPVAIEKNHDQTSSQTPEASTDKGHETTPSEGNALERAMMKRDVTPASTANMSDTSVPIFDDSEPIHERLNVDRAAHDVLAHAANARRMAEGGLLGRHAMDSQQRVDEEARRAQRALRAKRRAKALTASALVLVGAPVVTIAWLQFVPLNGYIPEAEKALSERLNEPTRVSKIRYAMLPSPRVILEGVTVGNTQAVRVNRLEAPILPNKLFDEPRVFDTIGVDGVTIDRTTIGMMAAGTGVRSISAMRVRRLALTDVKIDGAESGIGPVDGEVTIDTAGGVHHAHFSNDKMRIDVAPEARGLRVVMTAQDSRIPFGPAVSFSYLTIIGIAGPHRFNSTEISGRIAGGSFTGTLKARWDGPIVITGDFNLHNARLHDLAPYLTRDLPARGLLKVSGRYAFQALKVNDLLLKPQLEANFSVSRGEFANIDLVRATQGSGSSSFSGGRTGFDELRGAFQLTDGHYTFRQLQLSSTPLNAYGHFAVTPGGQLSGRVNAEIATPGAGATRTALVVGGTVKEPHLAY